MFEVTLDLGKPWWLQFLISGVTVFLSVVGSVVAALLAVYLARRRLLEVERHKAKLKLAVEMAPRLSSIRSWSTASREIRKLPWWDEENDLRQSDIKKLFSLEAEALFVFSEPAFKALRAVQGDLWLFVAFSKLHGLVDQSSDNVDSLFLKISESTLALIDALRVEIGAEVLDKSLFSTIGIQPAIPPESPAPVNEKAKD